MATILIVDDHAANRTLLTTLLGYWQHRLLEAASGIEALELARKHHPDLVITDLLMPEMDGFELVQHLRSDPATARTPVVFYTSNYPEQETRVLARTCGVRYFLPKPSEPQVILDAVNAALQETITPDPVPAGYFNREHRRLLTNLLFHKVKELERESGEQQLVCHTHSEDAPSADGDSDSLKRLTPRQREILQLIAEGH